MNYFCRQCHKPLMNGQQMCSCGQIFDNPVPDRDDQVEVVYWEPPKSTSAASRVQRIQGTWEEINPAAKAGGFGALAVLLIIAVLAGNHHPNPAANSRSITPPVVRPLVPVQSQVPPQAPSAQAPSAQAPLVLAPAHPQRRNDVDWSKVDSGNPPAPDVPTPDNTQTGQADSQQQTPENQEDTTNQQAQQYYNDGLAVYQRAKIKFTGDLKFGGVDPGESANYTNQIFADRNAIRNLESSVTDQQRRTRYEIAVTKLGTMALWTATPAAYPPPY